VAFLVCGAREEFRGGTKEIDTDFRGCPRADERIHDLFVGKGTSEEVIEAAKKSSRRALPENDSLFYAHLYLGLYEEALGHDKESLEHIRQAVNDYPQSHYMGDVGRVHLKLRENSKTN